ncbi:MAG: hypothetical protein WAQ27_02855 [Candidatus Microsaccharimonas sp.]
MSETRKDIEASRTGLIDGLKLYGEIRQRDNVANLLPGGSVYLLETEQESDVIWQLSVRDRLDDYDASFRTRAKLASTSLLSLSVYGVSAVAKALDITRYRADQPDSVDHVTVEDRFFKKDHPPYVSFGHRDENEKLSLLTSDERHSILGRLSNLTVKQALSVADAAEVVLRNS